MGDLEKLARDMASTGVRQVFGIPGGGTSLTLLDFLEKNGVEFCLNHFEGCGAIMAGVQGRLTGRAGAAIGIKGPGLANMIPGMAACRLERFPLVAVTESYMPDTPLSKAHKRMDHQGLIAAAAKGRRFLSEKGPDFKQLAAWAEAEAPGPVHLDIGGKAVPSDDPVPENAKTSRDQAAVWEAVAALIRNAATPVVIAGTLAIRLGWSARLNRLKFPVFSTAASKGVVDETLPHAAGVFTGAGKKMTAEEALLPDADLVIGVGLRTIEVLSAAPFRCPAVQLDPLGDMGCHGFDMRHVIHQPADHADELFDLLNKKSWGLNKMAECLGRIRRRLLAGPFLPAHAFSIIEEHFQHKARMVLDTGHFCTIGEHMWRARSADLFLGAGQGRYMGVGLPMAVGATLYDPSTPTILAAGDGGIGMFVAEIKLAVARKSPLLITLMTDGFLGSVRTGALRNRLTQKPVTIDQPSWTRVFEGFGVPSVRVDNEKAMKSALENWRPESGPLFIEAPFDPDAYQTMGDDLR